MSATKTPLDYAIVSGLFEARNLSEIEFYDGMRRFLVDSRKHLSFSQRRVAEDVGILQKTLSRYESGLQIPNPYDLVKLTSYYYGLLTNPCDESKIHE